MTAVDPRLSINQATIKYADLATALRVTAEAGVQAIGLWREPVHEVGLATRRAAARRLGPALHDALPRRLLHAPRGPGTAAPRSTTTASRSKRPRPSPPPAPRARPRSSCSSPAACPRARATSSARASACATRSASWLPDAAAAGVTLAIEPLHPMYASDRAVVSTLGQALDIAADFDPAVVGATVDTFHIWWDPDVLEPDRPRRPRGPHRDLPGVRLEDPARRRRAARAATTRATASSTSRRSPAPCSTTGLRRRHRGRDLQRADLGAITPAERRPAHRRDLRLGDLAAAFGAPVDSAS